MTSRKYLFVDDRWIAKSYAVHRRMGEVRKHSANPLIIADTPWEVGLNCYGTVLHDDGLFRMWYQVINRTDRAHPQFITAVGYAESTDGLIWTKPRVGAVHPVHGPTNLVMLSGGRSELCSPSVVRDRKARGGRRYKMMFFDAMDAEALAAHGAPFPLSEAVPGWHPIEGEGMFMAESADGIRWNRLSQPVFAGASDAAAMTQGPDGRLFATFKRSERPDRHFRALAASESVDGRRWSAPRIVLESDWRDPPGTEFYGMSPVPYFGNWIGLIWMYHNSPDDKSLDIQIATRRDGGSWRTPWRRAAGRATLLGMGPKGSWDAGRVYVASAPIVSPPGDPDGLWLYYGGSNVRHDDLRYKEHGIGLARLRLDGFAAMQADYFPGALDTKKLPVGGKRLMLNAGARHGAVLVSVRDAKSGKVLAEAKPVLDRDSTRIALDWQSGRLPKKGTEIRLTFEMRKAALYSFWFEG